MTTTFDILTEYFDSLDFAYFTSHDEQSLAVHLSSAVATYRLSLVVMEEGVRVSALVPVYAPLGSRILIAETILRINRDIHEFDFRLDAGDGHITLIVSRVVRGCDELDLLLAEVVEILDKYFPVFLSVIYGNEEPEYALKFV
jgi:hypothetical protein